MPYRSRNGLTWWYDDALDALGVVHGMFTREGGVSPAPWASLNASIATGDTPANVRENLERAFRALGRDFATRYDTWLVHGTRVVMAPAPRTHRMPPLQADAIITHNSRVTLLMRFADCLPILVYEPKRRVLGLAHAGWRSTAQGIALRLVEALVQAYDARPRRMLAVLGPAIGPDHYEVGPEVEAIFRRHFGEKAGAWFRPLGQRQALDLWAANAWQLRRAGVGQVRISGICTACDTTRWFSHRAEQGHTGRFPVLAALPGEIH